MIYRNSDYSLIQLLYNLISIMAFIWNLNLLFSQKSLYNLALKSILNMRAHCRRLEKRHMHKYYIHQHTGQNQQV